MVIIVDIKHDFYLHCPWPMFI